MKVNAWNSGKCHIVIGLLIIFVFISLAGCGKKEEDYREIQVYKIDGTATVERQNSSMEVYDNMKLQSGDIVETAIDSYLQLKLDEDKYIMLEPETKISLQASGNNVDSNTSIFLEKGAIVNQIDNPLSENSNYQVTTPNSTMAVRGTTFRVEITYDEKGESYAKVAVYGGKVECNLVFPDGTIAEPLLAEAGTEVLVWGDDSDSEYVNKGTINYEDLKEKVIEFLGVMIDRGEELSITKEELAVLKEALGMLEEEASDESASEQKSVEIKEPSKETESSKEKNVKPTDKNSTEVQASNEKSKTEKNQAAEGDKNAANLNSSGNAASGNSELAGNANTSGGDSTENNNAGENSTGSESTGGNSTGGNNTGEDSTGGDNTGEDSTGGDNTGEDSTGDNTGDDSTEGDNTEEDSTGSSTKEITINFCLSDGTTVFATKKQVAASDATEISGADITRPLLKPSAAGDWNYNAEDALPIENDVVTIKWISN